MFGRILFGVSVFDRKCDPILSFEVLCKKYVVTKVLEG